VIDEPDYIRGMANRAAIWREDRLRILGPVTENEKPPYNCRAFVHPSKGGFVYLSWKPCHLQTAFISS
jgi:hypothetical protein